MRRHPRRTAFALAAAALPVATAAAAVHLEVTAHNGIADGQDDLIAQFDTWNDTTWDVRIWADDPGVRVYDLTFDITADGNLTFTTLGQIDPTNVHDFLAEAPGTLAGNTISDVNFTDISFIGTGYVLPTAPASAWLAYSGFVANGGGFDGLVPPGRIDAAVTNATFEGGAQDFVYHGVQSYIEPTPGAAATLMLASGLLTARRRR